MPNIRTDPKILCRTCLPIQVPLQLIEDPDTGLIYWKQCPECGASGPFDPLNEKRVILA